MDKLIRKAADWTIVIVFVAIALIVFFVVPAKAEIQQARGVSCDTQEQMENWLMLFITGTPGDEALELVNAGTNACAVLHVIADMEEVKEGTINDQSFVIYKMTLMAVMTPAGPIPVEPLVQYMAAPKPKKKGIDA